MPCTTKRLPRFRREQDGIRPFNLTSRDMEIIRQVARHRFLSSPQIVALAGGAAPQILRRLQCLFHSGYLARPRCQIDYFNAGGSRPMVYGLASRGAGIMRQKFDFPFSRMDWDTKNRKVGRLFLDHAVMTAEIMIRFELACRASEGRVKYIPPDDLRQAENPRPSRHKPWHHWRVRTGGKPQSLIPDGAFVLEHAGELPGKSRHLCFIEADRGTMPLRRASGSGSCIERKIRLYTQLWKSGEFSKTSGANRVQVWIVTTGEERGANMNEAFANLPTGRGLFRFTGMAALDDAALLLGHTG